MPRKATGQVEWRKGKDGLEAWHVRVTLSKNDRPWVPMPKIPREDEDAAHVKGAEVSARMRGRGVVRASTAETVSEWFKRYYDAGEKGLVGRKNRGRPQAAIDDRRARFKNWIEPVIGTEPMATVTSEKLRRVVQRLDDQIRIRGEFYRGECARHEDTGKKPGLSPKSAASVWGELTSGFKEACSSKRDDLRARKDNPALGVQPPNAGEEREQAALYPSEVVALLSCELIPLARRRCYAVAIYTGMRRSELERLEAGDVDFEHDTIRVRGTKTNAAKRVIPIEATLRPLLEILVREAGEGIVLEVPRADGKGGAADLVKRDLERAELTRAELWRDDDVHMPFTFHGLRHTCITHWAVAGRGELFLLTAGGHTDVTMSKRYLAQAASVSAKFGTPHPTLPAVLVGVEVPPETDPTENEKAGKRHRASADKSKEANSAESASILTSLWRPQRESNPRYRRERPMS